MKTTKLLGMEVVVSPDIAPGKFLMVSPSAGFTAKDIARALSRATAPRRENWSWPTRTPSMPASGGSEPVRAAFYRFLDTGEPYCTEDE